MKTSIFLVGYVLSLANSQAVQADGDIVQGKYIVKYRNGIKRSAANDKIMSSQQGGRLCQIGETFEAVESELDDSLKAWADSEIAKGDKGIVEYYEPVQIARITQETCPNSQRSPVSWGQKRVTVERASDVGSTFSHNARWGEGVDAYILDTGIRCSHDEFDGERCTWGENFVSGSSNSDRQGHGTHVAGTVAGKTYGVAKRANVIAVKVLGDNGRGTTAGIIRGIQWVVEQARRTGRPSLVNMSLGGSRSRSENDAVEAAIRSGVSFAVSAGNDNGDACSKSPASAPSAVTVASTTSRDSRSSFSNFGSCTDIFAPGSNIVSAGASHDSATATLSGTSMSSPHVAGAMAVFLGQNPTASSGDVTDWLLSNAGNGFISDTRGAPNKMLNIPCDGEEFPPTTPTPPSPPTPPTPTSPPRTPTPPTTPTPPAPTSPPTPPTPPTTPTPPAPTSPPTPPTPPTTPTPPAPTSPPTPPTPPTGCADQSGCYGESCDYWFSRGCGCSSLSRCDCTGCSNCGSAPAPTSQPAASTPAQGCVDTSNCYGRSCDYWNEKGYGCGSLSRCDCSGCNACSSAPSPPASSPSTQAPASSGGCSNSRGCSRRSCDYWVSRGYQCSVLEGTYGCDCEGCQC